MSPSIVVLANLTATSEYAVQYAAVLSEPLQARLLLLHHYREVAPDPELVSMTATKIYRSQAEMAAALQNMTRQLPASTQVLASTRAEVEMVTEAVERYHPLLLVMGMNTDNSLLDQLWQNKALPVLRDTHWPVLVIPEAAPTPRVPRRIALAVDANPFTPNPASQALAPLLASWQATYIVLHAETSNEQQAFPGQRALANVRLSHLLPPNTEPELYEEVKIPPAEGIMQAVTDIQADLLVLIVRPHSFLGKLFHRSVTAQVLRQSRIPVLLLPAQGPNTPSWMARLT
ncbi:universal stress protein [Hymenobacter sp. BT188]|uniref:universal stress protein n=1 Tax=Hymenobacter sp. BT188 TaxID=2763504 RepID=UPI0016513DF0|nr:universal stress protein [Hymenobacter sp. BT188]MBC6605887.1 universal stress protein [Hymenobacter sp. BT188]